jgi:hypothetical protein
VVKIALDMAVKTILIVVMVLLIPTVAQELIHAIARFIAQSHRLHPSMDSETETGRSVSYRQQER